MPISSGGMIIAFLAFGLFPAASAADEWSPPLEVMGHRCLAEDMARLDAAVAEGDDLLNVQEEPGKGLLTRGVVTKTGFDINLPAHRGRWQDKGAPSKGGNALCPGYIWNFLSPPGTVMKYGPDEKNLKTWEELKISEQLGYIRQAEARFDDVDKKTGAFLKAADDFYAGLSPVGLITLKTNAPVTVSRVKSKFNVPTVAFRKPEASAIARMEEKEFKALWEALVKVITVEGRPELPVLKESSRKVFDAMAALHASAQEIFETLKKHGVTKNQNKMEFVDAQAKLYEGSGPAEAAVHQIAAMEGHERGLKQDPVVGIYDPQLSHALDFHFHQIVGVIGQIGLLERELKKPSIKLGDKAKDIMGSK